MKYSLNIYHLFVGEDQVAYISNSIIVPLDDRTTAKGLFKDWTSRKGHHNPSQCTVFLPHTKLNVAVSKMYMNHTHHSSHTRIISRKFCNRHHKKMGSIYQQTQLQLSMLPKYIDSWYQWTSWSFQLEQLNLRRTSAAS